MRKVIGFICLLLICATNNAQKTASLPGYKNASLPIEARIKDLLKRMTLEEKAGQLNQINGGAFTGPALNDAGQQGKMKQIKEGKIGTMLNVLGASETKAVQKMAVEETRLGIPLIFAYDVIHGYKTIFPIPLAEACSWDLKQVEVNSAVAAKEASSAGLHWTFAPMCDITNDPRWGRVMEGIGEDPYYGALLSAARVRGLQGNLDNNHVMACVKHFAGYGAVEAGKEYAYVDMSRTALWNKYLPPYKAAVEAGAATLMNGFNVFEGVPVSASKYLVTDVLKRKWNFKGLIVSDWSSFGEMINWGYADSQKDAALKAIKAGSMIDMESMVSGKYLPVLVKEGKVTMAEVDEAVGRVLYYKFKLGLFENPYLYSDEKREAATLFTPANRQEALTAATKSIVLLKNNNQVLPLTAATQKIASVGYFAGSKEDMFDFWVAQGASKDAVSLNEGLQALWKENMTTCNGYNADGTTNETLISEAVNNARSADVIVVNIGLSGKMAGEDRALGKPEIPQGQIDLMKALKETGKPIVAVVSAGRPLVLTQIEGMADAIVYSWILGTEHGNAVANVLTGAYNPSGKTAMSFPYAIGQIPVYYNHFNTGRPTTSDPAGNWYSRYRDIPREPLYPFGYGLSYTTFTYSDFSISNSSINSAETLKVNIKVTNTGTFDGEEVVQLYIRDMAASIVRPVKELKDFQKIMLKKGESKMLSFYVGKDKLSFYDAAGNVVLEKGKFKVFVGGNSKDVREADFELK